MHLLETPMYLTMYLTIAQRIVQVECTRMRTWDFECTEAGNQSYVGCRCPKCVLMRRARILNCNMISYALMSALGKSCSKGLADLQESVA